jgi:hypothetical protein
MTQFSHDGMVRCARPATATFEEKALTVSFDLAVCGAARKIGLIQTSWEKRISSAVLLDKLVQSMP